MVAGSRDARVGGVGWGARGSCPPTHLFLSIMFYPLDYSLGRSSCVPRRCSWPSGPTLLPFPHSNNTWLTNNNPPPWPVQVELRTTQAQLAEQSDQVDALQDELAGSGGRVRRSA